MRAAPVCMLAKIGRKNGFVRRGLARLDEGKGRLVAGGLIPNTAVDLAGVEPCRGDELLALLGLQLFHVGLQLIQSLSPDRSLRPHPVFGDGQRLRNELVVSHPALLM